MRQSHENDIGMIANQLFGKLLACQIYVALHAGINFGKLDTDILTRCNHGQFHLGVLRQDTHELRPGIAGGSNDSDTSHISSWFLLPNR
jgi:hypothetical protein